MPKLPMALKQYFESEPNGRQTPIADLKDFLLTMDEGQRAAAAKELESYGIEVTR